MPAYVDSIFKEKTQIDFNSSWLSQFKKAVNIFSQNFTMSFIFNVDYHGMKEIFIFRPTTEKWGKIWFFG